jgi:thioredoxin reductase
MRIAVLGAGPIGLEAANMALAAGHEVKVYERGAAADSVRHWGHIRMFSPFGMNASPEGANALKRRGYDLPDRELILTAEQYVEAYLQPLADLLNGTLALHTEVLGVSRERTHKSDRILDERRAESPFRLLLRSGDTESIAESDAVFDCAGTFLNPNPLGDGGLAAPGERAAPIRYGVPDVSDLAGARVLVVGCGHSAATIVRYLAEQPGTRITWAVRKSGPPFEIPDEDPLTERKALVTTANRLVSGGAVQFIENAVVERVASTPVTCEVTLQTSTRRIPIQVDHVIAATGFRPDLSLMRELQVQTCWATEGSYKLAALLLGKSGGDCLEAPVAGAETLSHPEPGYYTLGIKSYGRRSDFLIRTGHDQIRAVLAALSR